MPQNDIGEKIHRLRVERKMTQAELAGDQITRNMLSRVENGAALPSLPTVWYLADRLGVPAGFLLAEGDDDRVWQKMSRIESIRRVLRSGDARICLELCRGEDDAGEPDDEIYLIMAQCSLTLAAEAFERGHLHDCCALLDEAVGYADKTLYDASFVRARAALYLRFMHKISPTLYSELLSDPDDVMVGATDAIGMYILAREALDFGETRRVEAYLSHVAEGDRWGAHFRAHLATRKGDYAFAKDSLESLLRDEGADGALLLYCVFCDLEICCRETADFRGAYEYSQNKMALLEKMLQK